MRPRVLGVLSLTLIAAWTISLLGQGSQTAPAAPPMLALTGCVAAAAAPAGGANATPDVPSTSRADRYVLTKAAVAPPASDTPAAANQPKPPTATQYRLNGPDSMLAPYVAHQVTVSGRIEESSTQPASGANMPTFKVEAVRMIEATCS